MRMAAAPNDSIMRDVQEVLSRLSRSPFRSRIRLQKKELEYLRKKGMSEVLEHAAEFVEERLAPASPLNDGKQKPWRNHRCSSHSTRRRPVAADVYRSGTKFQRGQNLRQKSSYTLSA
jgi:hypothetical protein